MSRRTVGLERQRTSFPWWVDSSYAATHQKTITVDGTESLILTANLSSQYYSTGRDFGVFDTDSNDVSAIEIVFGADFAASSVTPGDGDDLVWSPTDSQSQLLALINNANDYGTSAAKVFIGSENFSSASLNKNRELGLILTDSSILSSTESTLTSDHNGGTSWS